MTKANPKCKTCRWWTGDRSGYGDCRKNSPELVYLDGSHLSDYHLQKMKHGPNGYQRPASIWPPTEANDYCGCHEFGTHPEGISIDDIYLSPETYDKLSRKGFQTLGNICNEPYFWFVNNGFTEDELKQIKAALDEFNVALRC